LIIHHLSRLGNKNKFIMREIKFRFWDTTKNVMSAPQTLNDIAHSRNPLWLTNKIPLQYTGVIGKNNIEIYEGDIVEAWSEGKKGVFEVRFRLEGSPCWLLWPNGQHRKFWNIHATEHKPGKQFISVGAEITTTDKSGYYDEGITVIGNIYENPDLLQH
jgi:uncharacterized phage protein (TIGR01671 family)